MGHPIYMETISRCYATLASLTPRLRKILEYCIPLVREEVATDEWRTAYVSTNLNPVDVLTKVLPSGEKRERFVKILHHYVFD